MKNKEELKKVIEEIKKEIAVLIYYNGDSKKIEARTQELKLLQSELDDDYCVFDKYDNKIGMYKYIK